MGRRGSRVVLPLEWSWVGRFCCRFAGPGFVRHKDQRQRLVERHPQSGILSPQADAADYQETLDKERRREFPTTDLVR